MFSIYVEWNLAQLLGYIKTWPGVIEYQRKYRFDIASDVNKEIKRCWGDPEENKKITWESNLLVGSVEK